MYEGNHSLDDIKKVTVELLILCKLVEKIARNLSEQERRCNRTQIFCF